MCVSEGLTHSFTHTLSLCDPRTEVVIARRLEGGDSAMLSEDAVQTLDASLAQFRAARGELLLRSGFLERSLSEYHALELPTSMMKRVISRARETLERRTGELAALDERSRLGRLREVTLDVVAAKVVIGRLARGVQTPDEPGGSVEVVIDDEHPGTPATLRADLPAPYIVTGAAELVIRNARADFHYALPRSYVAQVISAPGPFEISTESSAARIELVEISGNVLATVATSWPVGTAVSAEELAARFESARGSVPIESRAVFHTLRFTGTVSLEALGGAAVELRSDNPETDWIALGAQAGDKFVVEGLNSARVYGVSGVAADVLSGVALDGTTSMTEAGIEGEVGAFDRSLELRVTSASAEEAVREGWGIRVAATAAAGPTPATLGFPGDVPVHSAAVSAKAIAAALNAASAGPADVEPITARVAFARVAGSFGRSDPSNPAKLIAYRAQTRATITASHEVVVSGSVTAEPGDNVVVVEAISPAAVGAFGEVTGRAGATLEVDWTVAPSEGEVTIDIRPPAYAVTAANIIEGPNEGIFHIERPAELPGEWLLAEPLPRAVSHAGARAESFLVEFGTEHLEWVDGTTMSVSELSPEPSSPGAAVFFSGEPKAFGTSALLLLPPRTDVGIGDELEIDDGVSRLTLRVAEVAGRLVTLDGEVTHAHRDLALGSAAPLPRLTIKSSGISAHARVEEALRAFRAGQSGSDQWLRELERRIHQVKREPSTQHIAQVKDHLLQWRESSNALQGIVRTYSAPHVGDVDALIDTYRQAGFTRAADLLTAGRFAEFFRVGADSATYQATLLGAMRDATAAGDAKVSAAERDADIAQVEDIDEWALEATLEAEA